MLLFILSPHRVYAYLRFKLFSHKSQLLRVLSRNNANRFMIKESQNVYFIGALGIVQMEDVYRRSHRLRNATLLRKS